MKRADQRVGYVLKQAQQALRAALDDALRPHGLTTAQYAALAALEERGPLSGAGLARRAFVTPQTMTGIVAKLAAAGLVERQPGGADRRVVRLALSAAGRARLEAAHVVVDEVETRMLRSFGAPERDRFRDALRRCVQGLSGSDPEAV